jgi:two-component system response regulator
MRADRARPVLVAENDPDDFHLLEEAWRRAGAMHPLICAEDGIELLSRLKAPGMHPVLVLMDVKMPRKNGHEALAEMKADPELAGIPVVMLSTSASENDIAQAYQCGAASYLVKPDGLDSTAELVRLIKQYWLKTVELPAT